MHRGQKVLSLNCGYCIIRSVSEGKRWDVRQCFVRQLFGFSSTMQERLFLVLFFHFLDTFLVHKKSKFKLIELN